MSLRLLREPRVEEPLLPRPETLAVETQAAGALARRLQQLAVGAHRAEPHEVPVFLHLQVRVLVVPQALERPRGGDGRLRCVEVDAE